MVHEVLKNKRSIEGKLLPDLPFHNLIHVQTESSFICTALFTCFAVPGHVPVKPCLMGCFSVCSCVCVSRVLPVMREDESGNFPPAV